MAGRTGTIIAKLVLMLAIPAVSAQDAARGATLYAGRCGGCHSIDDNGPGPRHRGLFGRRAGTQPGFAYSPALQRSSIVWTQGSVDRWIADPNAMVPGNAMAVRLANSKQDRDDIVAYLRQATGAVAPGANRSSSSDGAQPFVHRRP